MNILFVLNKHKVGFLHKDKKVEKYKVFKIKLFCKKIIILLKKKLLANEFRNEYKMYFLYLSIIVNIQRSLTKIVLANTLIFSSFSASESIKDSEFLLNSSLRQKFPFRILTNVCASLYGCCPKWFLL